MTSMRMTSRMATTRSGVQDRNGNRRARQLAARRQCFITVAERQFLQHGFAETSVNAIVREAGGSLATLYAEFGTKAALFESVLCQRAARLFPDAPTAPGNRRNLDAQLRTLAAQMLTHMLSEDGLAVYRIAIHEAPRFPELRKTFLEVGMPGWQARIGHYLQQLMVSHQLSIDDLSLAATRFIALVQGSLVFTAACGGTIKARERATHVRQAVSAFLTLYPPRPGPMG